MRLAQHTREQIKAARSRLGLSQAQLARQIGVHQSTLSYAEKGRTPVSRNAAEKITAHLGIPLTPAPPDETQPQDGGHGPPPEEGRTEQLIQLLLGTGDRYHGKGRPRYPVTHSAHIHLREGLAAFSLVNKGEGPVTLHLERRERGGWARVWSHETGQDFQDYLNLTRVHPDTEEDGASRTSPGRHRIRVHAQAGWELTWLQPRQGAGWIHMEEKPGDPQEEPVFTPGLLVMGPTSPTTGRLEGRFTLKEAADLNVELHAADGSHTVVAHSGGRPPGQHAGGHAGQAGRRVRAPDRMQQQLAGGVPPARQRAGGGKRRRPGAAGRKLTPGRREGLATSGTGNRDNHRDNR